MLSSRAGSGDKLSPLQSGPTRMGHFSADAIGTEAKLATTSVAAMTPVLSVFMFNPPFAPCFETIGRMRARYQQGRAGSIQPVAMRFQPVKLDLSVPVRERRLPGFEIGW